MKNITFTKAGAENFCCYIEPMDFPFINDTIRLITGPNGSGKTTMYDIVPYTVYGVTTKGLKSEDVVNDVIKKDCHTFIEFIIDDTFSVDHYRIDRYCKHSKFGDTVLLFKNNFEKPIKKGQKEVLPEVEKLIVPFKLFTNTLLFGQKVKNFFTDLTDSEQKDIFRKVLQLDDYVLYGDECSKRIKNSKLDLEEIEKKLSLAIGFLTDTKSNITLFYERLKLYELNKKEEINNLKNEISNLESDISPLLEQEKLYFNLDEEILNKKSEEILNIENEIKQIDLEFSYFLQSLTNSKNLKESEFNRKSQEFLASEELKRSEKTSNLNRIFQELKSKNEAKINNLLNDIKNNNLIIFNNLKEIEKNKERISTLKVSLSKSNATCPTCGKMITEESVKEHLNNELNNLVSYHQKLLDENCKLDDSIQKIKLNEENIQLLINKEKEELDLNIAEVENTYNSNINDINKKLDGAKLKLDEILNQKKIKEESNWLLKKNDHQLNLQKLNDEKNKLQKLFDEKKLVEKSISKLNIELESKKHFLKNKEDEKYNQDVLGDYLSRKDNLEKEILVLNEEKLGLNDQIEILEFWKSGFSSSGIPSLLIDESIPFLNLSVSNYLEKIGGRYLASFDSLSTTKAGEYRDKININILDTKTKANHRKKLSGGQTRVVDIAILLSLCDLQNNIQQMKTNILLLDEIFDSLDDTNIGYVSSLLRTLVKNKSINIISHRHIDSIEADEILRLF